MTMTQTQQETTDFKALDVQSVSDNTEIKKRGRKPRLKERETTATFIISNERKGLLFSLIYLNNCKSLTNFINEALDYYVSNKYPESKEAFLKTNL